MDGNRFDELIRAAASRRRVLSGVLVMGVTGLGLPNVDAKAKRKPCAPK